ncbi:MAG: hypothetical protein NTY77_20190 [Elusimicrobia bacterium]|nr:hypothetical protein [Elusimicrobiota bacterium]
MRTLALLLLLAAPCRPAQGPVQVEAPDIQLEDSADPLTLKWRAAHCEARGQSAKRFGSERAAFELLPCLSHPDPGVRWTTLAALDNGGYFRRPDFERVILPKLRLAVAYSSKDQDRTVRSWAGELSRSIEQWESFDSPQAQARREQFRKDERRRTWLSFLHPDADLLVVYLGTLLFIVLLFSGIRFK